MPDYDDIVELLRDSALGECCFHTKPCGCMKTALEAAAAISALIAQQKLLVAEVEAARAWHDTDARSTGMMMELSTNWDKSRAATDAAFPEGLPK